MQRTLSTGTVLMAPLEVTSSPAASSSSTSATTSSSSSSRTSSARLNWLKAEARGAVLEGLVLLRGALILLLCCNTLFVGLGVVVVPFLTLSPQWAVTLLALLAGIYLPTYLGDPASNSRRSWKAFQEGFVIRDIIRWFRGDVVRTHPLAPSRQYIFAVAPHGVMPLSAVWMLCHEKWPKLFPSVPAVPLGSSVFHFAPLVRDLAMWAGTRQVSKKTFEDTLKEGKSVVMIPGGISELKLSSSRGKEILLSGKHRGFARMALVHGASIVPVYSFGETLPFDLVNIPYLSAFCLRVLKMPFPYFTGVGGFLQLPRRSRITVVVGAPIHVEHDPSPSEDKVAALHRRYYAEIQGLFETHKAQHHHADYTLRVLDLD